MDLTTDLDHKLSASVVVDCFTMGECFIPMAML
jgi:hypothetical protein